MTPEPEPSTPEIGDLESAFTGEPPAAPEATPDTPEPAPAKSDSALPAGTSWGMQPAAPEKQEKTEDKPEPAPEKTADGPIIPEGKELFEKQSTIDSWEGLKKTYQETKEELATLKKQLEEKPAANTEEIEKKIRSEYEAIARIRDTEAFAAEVMSPQAEALERAKQIGAQAHLDEEDITDLFRSTSVYEAERQLSSLGDDAAYNLLKPLVMDALEARQRGEAAMKTSDPVAELEQWQQRSSAIRSQQQQEQLQNEIAIDSAVFKETFQTQIANTPVAKTEFGKQKYEQVLQRIESGEPIKRDDVLRGLYELETSPAKDALISKQVQQIAQLKADLARIGGNTPPANPANPQPAGQKPIPGGVERGTVWKF